jgi:hypothetical protein
MHARNPTRTATVLLLATALLGVGTQVRAEPLITQGIGIQTCAKLDLKPSQGLDHPPNYLLFYWVQGYVSAANIALLEGGAKHIDMSALDEGKVLNLVLGFCKANPDKKPIGAIDAMIREAAKIKARWVPGTIAWDE